MKKYIGRSRDENLDWLAKVWLKDGPPVCFLHGFAGVGKTDLARDLRELAEKERLPDTKPKWQHVVINEIADRATPSVIESLMELSVTLSRQGLPEMERVLFEQKDPNLGYALERALQRPVVIILDEAQRFFREDTGAPLPEMNGILAFLRNRQNLQGRLLLLSDRIVEESRWSEWIPKRTLEKLEPSEAVEVLDSRLTEAGIDVEIAVARKNEVVRDLDFNPRAIEALVGALRYESLDDIIQSNPGLWAVHDREVSRDFLRALERDLLERTLSHLGDEHRRMLWRLAVHRRSFKREALEKLCSSMDEASDLRAMLVSRYLLNFYKSILSLNPIVREISLTHLREDPAEFKRAHSNAADYHLRHFKAKQIVGSQTRLGESFAELRYHLVQAGRGAELGVIEHRFTDHLKLEIKSTSPVPANREERDERIGVLAALLEAGGAKGLEYHLARCLAARGETGDIDQALVHARRALDRGVHDPWILCAELLIKSGKPEEAVSLLRDGIKIIPPEKNLFSLYQFAADLLAKSDKPEEAVSLLRGGIQVIPPEKNLFSLYQFAADLLAKSGEIEEAVSLLRKGIQIIPPDKSLSSLYQLAADLLAQSGKAKEAVSLLREGIQVIPPEKNLFSLYQFAGDLLAKSGETEEAVSLLREGIQVIPPDKSLSSLYQLAADLLAQSGKAKEAVSLLREGIQVIPPEKNLFSLYQFAGDLLAKSGETEEAVSLLREGIQVIPPDKSLSSLYQLAADLLAKSGKAKEAVSLLKGGIQVIPPEKNLFSLYQFAGDLLAKSGETEEAVSLLREGIRVIPPDKSLFSLYQMLGEAQCRAGKIDDAIAAFREGVACIPEQFSRYKLSEAMLYLCLASGDEAKLEGVLSATGTDRLGATSVALGKVLQRMACGDWVGAAITANGVRRQFPRYVAFAVMEAFSRLATGDADAALASLTTFKNLIFNAGDPHGWLAVFIHLRRGAHAEAEAQLATYLGRPVDNGLELTESFLLRLWDQQEISIDSHRLCFYFPVLPPSLTGLDRTVRRVQYAKPVLPFARPGIGAGTLSPSGDPLPVKVETEIYVSYAWGEDATQAGKRREEIVDRLCAAVAASGRSIGRDKDRVRGGDSIERFAHEISKSRRIIAIISEKSLHSEFCMAHELFRAFRRCDFQRVEFQEKVVALVMEDAEPFLKDNLAIVALAKQWQQRLERLKAELQSLDPNRKSPNLWVFVDMVEDMCPRLPDMLNALSDIVMKRGFDNIVDNGFEEVLSRLPPPRSA